MFAVLGLTAGVALVMPASTRADESDAVRAPHFALPAAATGHSSQSEGTPEILYDQFDHEFPIEDVPSEDYDDSDNRDTEAADDFVVPEGTTWNITKVQVNGRFWGGPLSATFHVRVYADFGARPGSLVATRLEQPYTGTQGNYTIDLSSPVVLTAGRFWISVQARLDQNDFKDYDWWWIPRSVESHDAAAIRNPGGAELPSCTTWTTRTACGIATEAPDQLFRLHGFQSPTEVVLYDQFDDPTGNGVTSQDFEAAEDSLDSELADDFVIADRAWRIARVEVDGIYGTTGPAESFHVVFYADAGGLPGVPLTSRLSQPYTGSAGDASIELSPPVILGTGRYWVSVRARQDFLTAGQWLWSLRSTQSRHPATYRNPNNGAGTGCTNWGTRASCFLGLDGPDQIFRLHGKALPGALLACGETIGYGPHAFAATEAANLVEHAFAAGRPLVPHDFAIFQDHDPWSLAGPTVIKDAITDAKHEYDEFAPAALNGFELDDYRVVILNWDDHSTFEFPDYPAAIPALERYVARGGVVWLQGAIQGDPGVTYPLPFGGVATRDARETNFIVDEESPTMAGLSNPLTANKVSHVSHTGMPAVAHVIKRGTDTNDPSVLYTLSPGIFFDDFESESWVGWSQAVTPP